MWELDNEEGRAMKKWCFQTVVLEQTLESPLDCKDIKPVNPKGNQPWILFWKDWCWRSNTLATWCKELTHWKRLWCWERLKAEEEKGTEDEMVVWHCWFKGHEFACENSRRGWGTGKPGVLQSMDLQRVGHNLATEHHQYRNEEYYKKELETRKRNQEKVRKLIR